MKACRSCESIALNNNNGSNYEYKVVAQIGNFYKYYMWRVNKKNSRFLTDDAHPLHYSIA